MNLTSIIPMKIRIKQDTIFKATSADSTTLESNQISAVGEGKEFTARKEGNHYAVTVYVWEGHAEPIQAKKLTDADFAQLSEEFGIGDVAAVRAVIDVEARGDGFLPDGRPIILFEAHHFARLTGHRYNASHPHISSRRWNRTLYKGMEREWPRINAAIALNRNAALQSASWGLGQVMGFNFGICGYDDVEDFVSDMHESEYKQAVAMFRFIVGNGLVNAIKRKDWHAFARGYNGSAYLKMLTTPSLLQHIQSLAKESYQRDHTIS